MTIVALLQIKIKHKQRNRSDFGVYFPVYLFKTCLS